MQNGQNESLPSGTVPIGITNEHMAINGNTRQDRCLLIINTTRRKGIKVRNKLDLILLPITIRLPLFEISEQIKLDIMLPKRTGTQGICKFEDRRL